MTNEKMLRQIIEQAVREQLDRPRHRLNMHKMPQRVAREISEQMRRAGLRLATNRPPAVERDDDD